MTELETLLLRKLEQLDKERNEQYKILLQEYKQISENLQEVKAENASLATTMEALRIYLKQLEAKL